MKQKFTITVLSKNRAGLLNRVSIIFTRRKINIDSITVSESEVRNVYQHTILVNEEEDLVIKVVNQLEKQIDIYKAFYYTDSEIVHQEIALYKVPTKLLAQGDAAESILRSHSVRVLTVEKEFTVLEKTGHKEETQELFEALKPFGIQEFVRSGRVAISKPMKELKDFLSELEIASKNI